MFQIAVEHTLEHPFSHEANLYTDEVEADMWVFVPSAHDSLQWLPNPLIFRLEAMAHPRCVGWGEMGLDYHYDNSPRDTQQTVFRRQLKHAVRLGKSLTIHTREAEEDTERILKEEVPREHKVWHPFYKKIFVNDLAWIDPYTLFHGLAWIRPATPGSLS